MKKHLLKFGVIYYTVTAILLLVALWIWIDIYVFEDGSKYTTIPTQALAVQRIESVGEDFRSYEFEMKTEPWTCVFAAGETKGGLFCVPTTLSHSESTQ